MDEDNTPEENAVAHTRLEAMVCETGLTFFPLTDGSADMVHQEPGLGITFTREADAIATGRAFRQRAVF